MTPSVGGWRKAGVVVLLAGASVATGALAGFGAGVAWAALPLPAAGGAALALLGATALAEAAYLAFGWPAPPSVRRQVPQVWTRLFAPETVAVLYGARLGVGPLTLLVTWTWWAALLAGAAAGPGASALAGAVFGGTRIAIMVVAAEWARKDMARRMGGLRAREGLVGAAVVAVLVLALAPAGVGMFPIGG